MKLKLTKKQIKILNTLYYSGPTTVTDIGEAIHSPMNATSNTLTRDFPNIEPPLIKKEKKGKYIYYSLTEAGKQFVEENPMPSNEKEKDEYTTAEMKQLIISLVINTSEDTTETTQLLKKVPVEIIEKNFSLSEFFFIMTTLNIVTEKQIPKEQIVPFIQKEEISYKHTTEMYNKFKNMLIDYSFSDLENRFFSRQTPPQKHL